MSYVLAMRDENTKAKRCFYLVIFMNFFLVALALSTIFITYKCWLITFSAITIIIRIISFLADLEQHVHEKQSAVLRRFAMLKNGIGMEPSEKELLPIYAKVDMKEVDGDNSDVYYSSTLPMGEQRLAIITSECAFFTGELSRKMAKCFASLALFGVVIIVLSIYLLMSNGILLDEQPAYAKAFITLALFFTLGDFTSLWRKYKSLSEECGNILNEGLDINKLDNITFESRLLLEKYLCILSKGPLIPTWIYDRYRSRFNQSWAKIINRKNN